MKTSFIIGIAGGSCAGKSTLANALARQFTPCATVISLDNYYRTASKSTRRKLDAFNWDRPSAIDFTSLINDLDSLRNGIAIEARAYDYFAHKVIYTGAPVPLSEVVIVEGALLFVRATVRRKIDFRVFIHTDETVRRERRLNRDTTDRQSSSKVVAKQFIEHVVPMHNRYIIPSAIYADMIVLGNEKVEAIVERILYQLLRKKSSSHK